MPPTDLAVPEGHRVRHGRTKTTGGIINRFPKKTAASRHGNCLVKTSMWPRWAPTVDTLHLDRADITSQTVQITDHMGSPDSGCDVT